jgi:hypothetical protein
MTRGGWRALLLSSACGVGAMSACLTYVPPDEPNYGPPSGLQGRQSELPSASSSGASGSSSGAATGSSSGTGAGSSSGTGTSSGTQYLCEQQGGELVDAGTCSVSFTTDLYPKMEASGAWTCASASCHATVAPVLSGSAQDYYTTLANYEATTSAPPYVNPCSTNPADSQFACNVATTGTCGSQMPLGAPLATAGQQSVATWVACGAPFN